MFAKDHYIFEKFKEEQAENFASMLNLMRFEGGDYWLIILRKENFLFLGTSCGKRVLETMHAGKACCFNPKRKDEKMPNKNQNQQNQQKQNNNNQGQFRKGSEKAKEAGRKGGKGSH